MKKELPIEEYLQQKAAKIERYLQEAIPSEWDIPAELRDSMQYSLMAGGKRMRPILVLAAVESLEGSEDTALPVASAYEMIHTYSLIHDDLPAMDNDDFRRGKLTNHKVFGDAMAILSGDALLTHAFFMITKTIQSNVISAEQIVAIVQELSEYAGAKGMVGGQAADILGEQGLTELSALEFIHFHKTGDLIVGALRAGGRVAGASEEQLHALESFGRNLGLAFQIQDDILDIIGDAEKIGKPIHSDINQQKVTYPFLIGMEESQKKVNDLTEQAKKAVLNGSIPNPSHLLSIANYLMKRDH